jgi:hypothetical protein
LASESGFDGFYMALLERKEEILKPKRNKKAEIEPAGAKKNNNYNCIYTKRLQFEAFLLEA